MVNPGIDLTSGIEQTLRPIEEARGLPNPLYTEDAALRRERDAVFGPGWACIGAAHQIPNVGDARPVDLLGLPLFMVRGRDQVIRVFHNVCRHRGMVLVERPTSCRSVIRCPYHSWCYEHDGRLRATPHAGGPGHNAAPSIDRAALGLKEVRSAVWAGLVFVNLSGTAPAFASWIATLAERWHDFDLGTLHHGFTFGLDVGTNWKLAVENYCESYHLPWVHPGLNSYSRLEDHYTIVEDGAGRAEAGAFAGQGTQVYRPALSEDGRRFPVFPGLPGNWDTAAEYVALFPNVLLGIHKDHFFAIRLEPLGPKRTLEHVDIWFADGRALDDDFAPLRSALEATWREVFEEDVFVVEGMQRGRASPAYDGGIYAPAMEAATHAFHRWVAQRLQMPLALAAE